MFSKRRAFTLIELLIVIVIIIALTSIVIVNLRAAQAKSRDARRKSDLTTISTALTMWYGVNSSYLVFGGGYDGSGTGFINHKDPANHYPESVNRVLYNGGYLGSADIDDPVAARRLNYMIYLCPQNGVNNLIYSLSATLEVPTQSETAYARKACEGSTIVDVHKKNYAIANRTVLP